MHACFAELQNKIQLSKIGESTLKKRSAWFKLLEYCLALNSSDYSIPDSLDLIISLQTFQIFNDS